MNEYCSTARDYLRLAYDEERALFSYSSHIGEDGELTNDFRLQASLRYTINTYLGLAEAERHHGQIDWLGSVGDRVRRFIELHEAEIETPADRGLLLVLLAATDPAHPAVERSLDALDAALAGQNPEKRLNMQDLSWMLWGVSTLSDNARARDTATRTFGLTQGRYVHPETGLPRHEVARYRAHTVSFGSVVYFLRAMYEYGEAFDSQAARQLFRFGVQRIIQIQGADGAWPWMIDVRTGFPYDVYPIFTVHQDSMAMLFLLPAAEQAIEGAREAIELSLRWNRGGNELHTDMVKTDPYPWIYRSVERAESLPRLRRYLRSLGRPPRGWPSDTPSVRINDECRSYHLGWVLYTWSDPSRTFPLHAAGSLV